jgi:hypothetical protein
MQFRKRLLLPFLGAAAICASGLAIRPAGTAETGSTGTLLMGAGVDGATLALIERSCQSCHSERTEWPWYSRVPIQAAASDKQALTGGTLPGLPVDAFREVACRALIW